MAETNLALTLGASAAVLVALCGVATACVRRARRLRCGLCCLNIVIGTPPTSGSNSARASEGGADSAASASSEDSIPDAVNITDVDSV